MHDALCSQDFVHVKDCKIEDFPKKKKERKTARKYAAALEEKVTHNFPVHTLCIHALLLQTF